MRIPFAARAAVVAVAQVRAALQLFIDVKPLEMATAPASPTIQLQNRHIFKTETAPIDPRATPSRLDATFSPTALLAVCATRPYG